jgi:hypothetical protein
MSVSKTATKKTNVENWTKKYTDKYRPALKSLAKK